MTEAAKIFGRGRKIIYRWFAQDIFDFGEAIEKERWIYPSLFFSSHKLSSALEYRVLRT